MNNQKQKGVFTSMKAWLKGGLIGSGIFIISYIFTQVWCRIQPGEFCGLSFYLIPNYIMQFTGIDYIVYLFTKNIFGHSFLIFSFLLFFAIGAFVGFLLSKKISWKKKLIFSLIIILFITPLSLYSHSLKQNDEKILSENRFGAEGWFISDYSVCKELSIFTSDYLKDECLSSSLIPKEKTKALNEFSKTPEMQECLKTDSKWTCISEVAVKLNDEKICEYHVLEDAIRSCMQRIGIQRNDISFCQEPPEPPIHDPLLYSWEEYTYNDCIIAIAKNTNNVVLCGNIQNNTGIHGHQYDECKLNFIEYTLESCETLENHESYDTRFKDDCIIKVAFNQINLTVCELTEHPQKREECIAKIAMKTRNVGLCKTFKIIQSDECIKTIAYLEEDKTICNNLEMERVRDKCFDDIEDYIKGRLEVSYIEEYR